MVPTGQKNAGRRGPGEIEWREAACGTITLSTARSDILRRICHGRMPESGQGSLKQVIADAGAHLRAQTPDRRRAPGANGAQGTGHRAFLE